jgi:hypothetical protein
VIRYIATVVICLSICSCKSITSCFIIDLDEVALNPSATSFSRSPEYQAEIDEVLAIDAENKRWELIYIKEIKAAVKHEDIGAYQFFLEQFINAPRLSLPEWLKQEPGYVPEPTIDTIRIIRVK